MAATEDIEERKREALENLVDCPDPRQAKEWGLRQTLNFLFNAREDQPFSYLAKTAEMDELTMNDVLEFEDFESWSALLPDLDEETYQEMKKCFDGTYSWPEVYPEFAEFIQEYIDEFEKEPSPPPPPPTICVLEQQFPTVNSHAIRDVITFQAQSVGVQPQLIQVVRQTAVLQFATPEQAAQYKTHFETSEQNKCFYPKHLEDNPELNTDRAAPALDESKLPEEPRELPPLEPTPSPSPPPERTPTPDFDSEEFKMPIEEPEDATEARAGLMHALKQLENDESVREYPKRPPADVYGVCLSSAKRGGLNSGTALRKLINETLGYPSNFQENVPAIGEAEAKQEEPRRKKKGRGRRRGRRRDRSPPRENQPGAAQEDQKDFEAVVDERQYMVDLTVKGDDVVVYFWSRTRQNEFVERCSKQRDERTYKLGFQVRLSVIKDDHPLELELAAQKILEAVSEFGTILSYQQNHATRELIVWFETLESVQILAHYNRIQLGPNEYIECSHLPSYVQIKPVTRTMKRGWENAKIATTEDADKSWEQKERHMSPVERIMAIGYVETEAIAQRFLQKHLEACGGDEERAVDEAIQDITMKRYESAQMCLAVAPRQEDHHEEDDLDQVR